MPIGQEAGVTSSARDFSISSSRSNGSRASPPVAPRLDLARELDRPAKQQQFLSQRGLAGVGVRNDRKGAPARYFVGQGTHHSALAVVAMRGAKLIVRTTTIHCIDNCPCY